MLRSYCRGTTDIDGLHFDYIRYPEGSIAKGYSHRFDQCCAIQQCRIKSIQADWEDWQREQVNRFVFNAYNVITSRKPWVKVSAAVIGKYMEAAGLPIILCIRIPGLGWNSENRFYRADGLLGTFKSDSPVCSAYHRMARPCRIQSSNISGNLELIHHKIMALTKSTDRFKRRATEDCPASFSFPPADWTKRGNPGVTAFPYWSLVSAHAVEKRLCSPSARRPLGGQGCQMALNCIGAAIPQATARSL